ncbi:hypothetical protein GGI06_000594, partial [Coemansia sp. S85]
MVNEWLVRAKATNQAQIPGVKFIEHGFRCVKCRYAAAESKHVSDHYKKNHPNESSSITATRDRSASAHVQQPFTHVGSNAYIQVNRVEGMGVPSSDVIPPALEDLFEPAASFPNLTLTDLNHPNVNVPLWIRDLGWDRLMEGPDFALGYAALKNVTLSCNWRPALVRVIDAAYNWVQAEITNARPGYQIAMGSNRPLNTNASLENQWLTMAPGNTQYRSVLVDFLVAVLIAAAVPDGLPLCRVLGLTDVQVAAARDFYVRLTRDILGMHDDANDEDADADNGNGCCNGGRRHGSGELPSDVPMVTSLRGLFWRMMEKLCLYIRADTILSMQWSSFPVLAFLCLRSWDGTKLYQPHVIRPLTSPLIYWIRATLHSFNVANHAIHDAHSRLVSSQPNQPPPPLPPPVGGCHSASVVLFSRLYQVPATNTSLSFTTLGPILIQMHLLVCDNMESPSGSLFRAKQVLKAAEGTGASTTAANITF